MKRKRDSIRPLAVTCLLLLLSIAGLAPAFAQDPVAAPGFRIETITVQGARREAAHAIVAGETRLLEGETYGQAALDQALYRVRRLPFVLAAGYELREGSAPGAYELVITIHTYTAVRLVADAAGFYDGDSRGPEADSFDTFVSGEFQARSFVGERGMAFASVWKGEKTDPVVRAGYTQYGLLGPGSFATVAAARVFSPGGEGVESEDIAADLAVGLPVTPNNTLRLSYGWSRSDVETAVFQRQAIAHSPEVQWLYDTTDDPLFALRGTQMTGTALYRRDEEEIRGRESASLDSYRLTAAARHYLPFKASQSLGFTLASGYQALLDGEPEQNSLTYSAGAGHFANLWETEVSGWRGRLRLENQLVYLWTETDAGSSRWDESFLNLSSGLVFRANWGILRATVFYQETV